MPGNIETPAVLTAEVDSVLAVGQGAGAITAARVLQLMQDVVASLAPAEATLTYAASMGWDVDTQPTAQVTLTGNVTIALSGGTAGQTYRLAVFQDSTGSRTVALTGCTVLGTPIWQTAAGALNLVTVDTVGSTLYVVVT